MTEPLTALEVFRDRWLIVRQDDSSVITHDGRYFNEEHARLFAAAAELLGYIRPFVAMTFHEGAAAEKAGKSLIFCQQDKLNPCWDGRKTDIIGKHWDGESPACDACNLRAAIAKARGKG